MDSFISHKVDVEKERETIIFYERDSLVDKVQEDDGNVDGMISLVEQILGK